ncbi:ABC-F family ATP-binding cassette domain-containing protein [Actinokineospora globicatena]|uniref:ABC transporter ATP-binding protein n=1 Tax=Actinokineospora globicatena TaxID=103729 RepID=A0A9W6QMJ4_9PSEU|nr:ATP-binding cassette domain-containing protein [Actinokineospora globicatena]MCP2302704.1 ATPase components of ABC transporters with duplicated ATPase domains [Actinokineospora globicatena]GLW75608.1 ABC transporter ATP-binding protein [Actinokineospora globicatena]GLW82448.1 ABC transporter ATP-binding protein [Actinokineospora globicatena]GLW91390.1 ABC transporter ATP-binding protein [Actinokineospora globicatena]
MHGVGHLEANGLSYTLPDGRVLFRDAGLKVNANQVVAVVGENGAGKTTMLRIIAGELSAPEGSVSVRGGMAVMPQFVGSVRDDRSVRDLLLSVAPAPLRAAAQELDDVELALMETDDEPTQLRYASALVDYDEAGGYTAEVLWDTVTTAAMGVPYEKARFREVRTLSGGEQKRLVLETLLRGREQVLLLDEPDNYLDVPGKRWLEERLAETDKAVLLISHDRELLNAVATHVVTVEAGTAWTHAGGFATWADAREARWDRIAEQQRRWDEEHEKLKELVRSLQRAATMSDGMASRYRAAQTRLRKFEEAGPPPVPPRPQRVTPRLTGGRTGVRVITCEQLELTGLMKPFDIEVFYGDRLAVLGSNGSGKSHFLRLLSEGLQSEVDSVAHTGVFRLGARVNPGLFAQTHQHPEWLGRTLVDILWHGDDTRPGLDRGAAASALSRYGLAAAGEQRFETLSGGQQARLQILLLELSGATLLLLDEPTDNLDLHSAEALQDALTAYSGTVVAVTHDRWFARSFDRFLVFRADGQVSEVDRPVWDERRVVRERG